jgi:hypothetical protein
MGNKNILTNLRMSGCFLGGGVIKGVKEYKKSIIKKEYKGVRDGGSDD